MITTPIILVVELRMEKRNWYFAGELIFRSFQNSSIVGSVPLANTPVGNISPLFLHSLLVPFEDGHAGRRLVIDALKGKITK